LGHEQTCSTFLESNHRSWRTLLKSCSAHGRFLVHYDSKGSLARCFASSEFRGGWPFGPANLVQYLPGGAVESLNSLDYRYIKVLHTNKRENSDHHYFFVFLTDILIGPPPEARILHTNFGPPSDHHRTTTDHHVCFTGE